MSAVSVEALLGSVGAVQRKAGARTAKGSSSFVGWIDAVRHGLPARTIDAIARSLELTQAELSATLAIPERTLIRRKKEGTLSADESAKMLRVARVMQRAIEVFEDRAHALHWLKSVNRALGGVTPLSLLDTDLGAEAVLDTLGRIEHGVFA
jgi:putative toxin-antitoxin system antitoxin component (TIGR02293 family)